VVKSKHSANLPTEKKTSSTMLDCSLLPDSVSELQLSPSPSEKMAPPAMELSQLPEELLQMISEKLEDCFDVIHARSVCGPWRSIFPFPSCLLRTSYSLPSSTKFPRRSRGSCTLEKFPMFLFRVRSPADVLPSEFFLEAVGQDMSADHMKLPNPIQCSVKVKMGESDPILMNIVDCQILPLGYQYRMVNYDPDSLATRFGGVAFLPLRGGKFVVLIGHSRNLLVFRSAEMRWMRLEGASEAQCKGIIAFRGRFYATFLNGDIFVIDPYTLIPTPLMPSPLTPSQPQRPSNYLFAICDDELFLVEKFNPFPEDEIIDLCRLALRVSVLDEKAGEWAVVTDMGDRVFFSGHYGNVSCSGKDLPDGCGLSKNSIVFTNFGGDVTYAYKYGVHTGREEDDLSFWRFFSENRVNFLKTYSVVTLRVEREAVDT
ncbi:unnamed protein product, partial [Thlaspi arvense]